MTRSEFGHQSDTNEHEPSQPSLLGIFISAEDGAPMKHLDSAKLIAGKGIEGDRYALLKGSFNKGKKKRIPDADRQVTLISSIGIAQANEALLSQGKPPFSYFETRRNLVVNMNPDELNSLVGKQFKLGEITFEAVELCDPCGRPDALSGKKGFEAAFQNRGGIRTRVLTDGVISIGDALNISEVLS